MIDFIKNLVYILSKKINLKAGRRLPIKRIFT